MRAASNIRVHTTVQLLAGDWADDRVDRIHRLQYRKLFFRFYDGIACGYLRCYHGCAVATGEVNKLV